MRQPQSRPSPSPVSNLIPPNKILFSLVLLACSNRSEAAAENTPMEGNLVAQLQEAIQGYEQELSRLTQVNQSLQRQLTHTDINALSEEQQLQCETATLQTEKMAALGMLMAGVAHEINTPLGAIQASAENIDYSISHILKVLPQLYRLLSEAQLAAFEQLLTWAQEDSGNRSSREERQLKREITNKLQVLEQTHPSSSSSEHKVPNHQVAALLSTMGITQDLQALLPILQSPEANLILNAAYSLSTVQANSRNIGIAVGRANNIVGSLRNYARKSVRETPTLSHLHKGLETVLTLYQNKLKHSIELVKKFEDVPPLLCCPEELEQAWSNLIGNAIQAMDGQGKLEISLTQVAQSLVIQITDSGPGIPEAIQDKIFLSYFTTKPMGQGSGLGLSITQKIISRHGGVIEVSSHPGNTCFKISLPLKAPTLLSLPS